MIANIFVLFFVTTESDLWPIRRRRSGIAGACGVNRFCKKPSEAFEATY